MAALEQTFFELFDSVADLRGRSKADLFLQMAISRYGLRHIAYAAINVLEPNRGYFYVNCTYPDYWVDRYLAKDYIMIDPVVRRGVGTLTPFDWSDLPKRTAAEKHFFGESLDFGLGRQGITIPIRGPGNQIGLFNINSDVGDGEWRSTSKVLLRDFQILATLFHDGVICSASADGSRRARGLSPRENECLKWAAGGKTAWETSVILGISERSVRFHLDRARHKLNCLTKVHAVAKAVALGLVTLS